tara:strand:- start:118 stop:420 length:303 start_codon:yes stop_codon:yes gene_type:complete
VSEISLQTDSMIYLLYKKVENIIFRFKAIQKSYSHVNNHDLKNRLLKEYEDLKISFFQIRSLIKMIDYSSSDKLTISKLLDEKCNRCENEIFKNKYLFSA